jgi:hypothetical protein
MQAIPVNLSEQDLSLTGNVLGAEVSLSLRPFVKYVEQRCLTDKTAKARIYKYILNQFYEYPELEQPIAGADTGKYVRLFELIYTTLSPLLNEEDQQLWALGAPVSPFFFFGTQAFYAVLLDPSTGKLKAGLKLPNSEDMEKNLRFSFYNLILKKFYQFSLSDQDFTVKAIVDPETQLLKYYRLNIDTRFIEIHNHGTLPELSLQNLRENLRDETITLELLTRLIPTNQFSVEGISVVTLVDVTEEYALGSIKNVIVEHNECSIGGYDRKVTTALKTIAGSNEVEFGLLPYLRINNKAVLDNSSGFPSILLRVACDKNRGIQNFQELMDDYLANPHRLIFPEIEGVEDAHYPMLQLLWDQGIRSYALLPVYYSGKLVGCLEVYARDSTYFTTTMLSKLDGAFSLLAQLFQNIIADFDNEIARVITDKFTSIQPAVQWRFNEAAYHYVVAAHNDEEPPLESILFEKVQPFYAAVDIKDSSVERNLAIRNDLYAHFDLLTNTLESLKTKYCAEDDEQMSSGALICKYGQHDQLSDLEILRIEDYLLRKLPAYLIQLRESQPELRDIIQQYFDLTQPGGQVYAHRREYEESMQTINRRINAMLDAFNSSLQEIYPCYFEKFRTDGVEFDIYLGQSIAPEIPMPADLIRTFRFLHLQKTAEIARATHALVPQLAVPLQTTQLIFVHEKLIDISFRPDEQRFDVEGSYNIRYQLVKKRIDKVHLKHSAERLTQPGKVAIVYLNNWEAQEYLGYINKLQAQHILDDDVEFIELEELQGVDGLKAIRVSVLLDTKIN